MTHKAPSQRMLRVGELIRHELAEVFLRGEVHALPIDTALITVPEVRVSPDLKIATVYVMPLGGKGQRETVQVLAANARAIRGALAGRIRDMKYMPALRFRIDESFDEGERIEAILASEEVQRDLRRNGDED